MARGQSQAADTNLATTNAVGAQENQKANALESTLVPGYTSMMNTGYGSPEEEGAAVTSEMGASTQPFESGRFRGESRAAATHNDADLSGMEDQLALDEGRAAGSAAANLNKEKSNNELAGMYGLHQLQSGDQQAAAHMYGLGPSTLSARAGGMSGPQEAMGWLGLANAGSQTGANIHD